MAEKKFSFQSIKDTVKEKASSIDTTTIKEKANKTAESISVSAGKAAQVINDKAGEIKNSAKNMKDDIEAKVTELDRMLNTSITEYNDIYTQMSDKGMQLFVERNKASELITYVENLVNSLANRPKSFDTDFADIETGRKSFKESCDFADRELQEARKASIGAGTGLAAGATVAFMGPTAAMWVATTFGTASTGAAISSLAGAAANSAALAWLGGGALTAGGGGIAAGNALLALSGPIGWSIAGATLLTTIVLFSANKVKLNKQKNEEIESVKRNIEKIKEVDAEIAEILFSTNETRKGLSDLYMNCMSVYGADYSTLTDEKKMLLGSMINATKALSAMFDKTVTTIVDKDDIAPETIVEAEND